MVQCTTQELHLSSDVVEHIFSFVPWLIVHDVCSGMCSWYHHTETSIKSPSPCSYFCFIATNKKSQPIVPAFSFADIIPVLFGKCKKDGRTIRLVHYHIVTTSKYTSEFHARVGMYHRFIKLPLYSMPHVHMDHTVFWILAKHPCQLRKRTNAQQLTLFLPIPSKHLATNTNIFMCIIMCLSLCHVFERFETLSCTKESSKESLLITQFISKEESAFIRQWVDLHFASMNGRSVVSQWQVVNTEWYSDHQFAMYRYETMESFMYDHSVFANYWLSSNHGNFKKLYMMLCYLFMTRQPSIIHQIVMTENATNVTNTVQHHGDSDRFHTKHKSTATMNACSLYDSFVYQIDSLQIKSSFTNFLSCTVYLGSIELDPIFLLSHCSFKSMYIMIKSTSAVIQWIRAFQGVPRSNIACIEQVTCGPLLLDSLENPLAFLQCIQSLPSLKRCTLIIEADQWSVKKQHRAAYWDTWTQKWNIMLSFFQHSSSHSVSTNNTSLSPLPSSPLVASSVTSVTSEAKEATITRHTNEQVMSTDYNETDINAVSNENTQSFDSHETHQVSLADRAQNDNKPSRSFVEWTLCIPSYVQRYMLQTCIPEHIKIYWNL